MDRARLLRNPARLTAGLILAVVFAATLMAGLLANHSYSAQFREFPDAAPNPDFPLGTDELGRDRFSRLLYGSRVSLLLAPAASLLTVLLAALVGGAAGFLGGWWERALMAATDLFLSLPWLFLLLTVRATLPLNVSPETSVLITFGLLGLLGWPSAARVVCSGVRSLRHSDFVLQLRACGCPSARLMLVHVLPNLKPVLSAQFWISVPVFLLTEANLGLLGLGVAEPLPSWGSLLRELSNFGAVADNPWMLTPAALLLVVVSCLQFLFSRQERFR